MDIHVFTTFLGPLTQDTFSVRTIDEHGTMEYTCSYEAGEWDFKMYGKDKLILESQRINLPGKDTFLGRREYRIIWEEKEIGVFKKSYMKKVIVAANTCYPFPGIFRPNIPELNLTFPFSALIWRRKVRSHCLAKESEKAMLSIALTIYVWFTWNALPAD